MPNLFGKYQVKLARSPADLAQVMALRRARFGVGQDDFDAGAQQVMVCAAGEVLCSYRLIAQKSGTEIGASYSAQFYDLSALHRFTPPVVELGRFCMAAHDQNFAQDPDILRLAFAGMARVVGDLGAGLLFGCASFAGHEGHLSALDALRGHLAPPEWPIGKKSPHIVDFAARDDAVTADGIRAIPPLLRNYLALGGWVSDHAVADHALNTLHVFTGVMIDKIPAPRAEMLRKMAQEITLS